MARDEKGNDVYWWELIDPKTTIAFTLIGTLCVGFLFGKWLGIEKIPDWLLGFAGPVIGYYFSEKIEERRRKEDKT